MATQSVDTFANLVTTYLTKEVPFSLLSERMICLFDSHLANVQESSGRIHERFSWQHFVLPHAVVGKMGEYVPLALKVFRLNLANRFLGAIPHPRLQNLIKMSTFEIINQAD